MTDEKRLTEQIKMEADEVLFDGVHFDTRLKDKVRQRVQVAKMVTEVVPGSRRRPWLQLSMVAAVFAVVIIGSRFTLPGQKLARLSASNAAPSSAPPSEGSFDMMESETANKLMYNDTSKPKGDAARSAQQVTTVTVGQATEQIKSYMLSVKATSTEAVKREYQLEANLPEAPVALKTAAEALEELQQRELAPDEPHGRVTITKVELVQRPLPTGQAEKALCYHFSGVYENGAAFSHYVYAEKGKTGIPE